MMPEVITLWPERPAGTKEWSRQEQETIYPHPRFNNLVRNMKVVRNITEPTLTVYHPDPALASGTAVILCPGGGFLFLPIDHEGTDVARWLNARGLTACVLRYRLMPAAPRDEDFFQPLQRPSIEAMQAHAPLAVQDGKQAVRLMRECAPARGIDPTRIGVLGFSAGGVVATGVATQYETESRPDFVGALYSPCWYDSNVPEDAPPLFLAFAGDDPLLSMVLEGSLRFYRAWQSAGHPVELHSYTRGGHGFGMAQQGYPSDHWIERFVDWLKAEALLA
jgi:acetyl esterase/lipase